MFLGDSYGDCSLCVTMCLCMHGLVKEELSYTVFL